MEETIVLLKKILKDSPSKDPVFRRNVLKEYFQVVVLDFMYSHPVYSQIFFYGGSCLAHCYGLPRLSEDLDFVNTATTIDLDTLAKELKAHIRKEAGIELTAKRQKFRVYLKFPILHKLGLASASESDLLFLKVEIFQDANFCKDAKIEHIPLFKFNRSIIIKTFDLPTLMATKIRAVLLRNWKKTDKNGNVLAVVKGRDYFDLMWYLERGVRPNLTCLPEAKDLEDLKRQLLAIIKKVDAKSIRYDLEAFIDNARFLDSVSLTMKSILETQIAKLQ